MLVHSVMLRLMVSLMCLHAGPFIALADETSSYGTETIRPIPQNRLMAALAQRRKKKTAMPKINNRLLNEKTPYLILETVTAPRVYYDETCGLNGCTNKCEYSSDGACDDPANTLQDDFFCGIGSDCDDCGTRSQSQLSMFAYKFEAAAACDQYPLPDKAISIKCMNDGATVEVTEGDTCDSLTMSNERANNVDTDSSGYFNGVYPTETCTAGLFGESDATFKCGPTESWIRWTFTYSDTCAPVDTAVYVKQNDCIDGTIVFIEGNIWTAAQPHKDVATKTCPSSISNINPDTHLYISGVLGECTLGQAPVVVTTHDDGSTTTSTTSTPGDIDTTPDTTPDTQSTKSSDFSSSSDRDSSSGSGNDGSFLGGTATAILFWILITCVPAGIMYCLKKLLFKLCGCEKKKEEEVQQATLVQVVPNGPKNAAYLETVRRQYGAGSIGTLFFFCVQNDVDR